MAKVIQSQQQIIVEPWWVTLLWALFFYTASYGLFSMIARIQWLAAALTLAALIVVGIRLIIIL